MPSRRVLVGFAAFSFVSALFTPIGAQEVSLPPRVAGDAVSAADSSLTPSTPIVIPPGLSHPVIGSRVRLQYTPSTSAGTLDRFDVVEGTLVATDAERFTIAKNESDTTIVLRRQAMSIMVRERFAPWPTAIGVGLFGLFIGHAFTSHSRDLLASKRDFEMWPWVTGGAAAGVTAVVLSRGRQWVSTPFPP